MPFKEYALPGEGKTINHPTIAYLRVGIGGQCVFSRQFFIDHGIEVTDNTTVSLEINERTSTFRLKIGEGLTGKLFGNSFRIAAGGARLLFCLKSVKFPVKNKASIFFILKKEKGNTFVPVSVSDVKPKGQGDGF